MSVAVVLTTGAASQAGLRTGANMGGEMWEMFCPDCGRQNRGTARFCIACGSSLCDLAPGTLLEGRYRVDARLGGGSMGVVYRAWDTRLECPHALKELVTAAQTPAERQEALARFRQEARLLTSLRHPGLPRVLDFFARGHRHYLVMDLVEGEDLETCLERDGTPGLPEAVVRDAALQVLDILEYLHGQSPSILYRDLKPANIMQQRGDGRYILVDFGIARPSGPGVGTAIGTDGFAPPEQYRGQAEIRSDLYALGATMHYLLSGRAPIPCHFESLLVLAPHVSRSLAEIVHRALELGVEDRFATARQMREALESVAALPGGEPATPPLPASAFPPVYPPATAFVPSQATVPAPAYPPAIPLAPFQAPMPPPASALAATITPSQASASHRPHPPASVPFIAPPVHVPGHPLTFEDDEALRQAPTLGRGEGLAIRLGPAVTDIGLQHLRGLVGLESLDLAHTCVTDPGLYSLRWLHGLKRLDLTATSITSEGLAHLETLDFLEVLVLASTRVDRLQALHVPSLCHLDLSATRMDDLGITRVQGLPALRTLSLASTQVTEVCLKFMQPLAALQELDLSRTLVGDPFLRNLRNLTSLRSLDLCHTRVTDAGLRHLRTLGGLKVLGLGGVDITDGGLQVLRFLRLLERLTLASPRVTDASLTYLERLEALKVLTLQGTGMSPSGLARLRLLLPSLTITTA